MADYRTPLARARGLGAAGNGSKHWIGQRVSALALLVLGLWFVWSLALHSGFDYDAAIAWVRRPHVAVTLLLTVAVGFYHMYLGLRVVIEDYVHQIALKSALLVMVFAGSWLMGVAAIVSVLRIFFGGSVDG